MHQLLVFINMMFELRFLQNLVNRKIYFSNKNYKYHKNRYKCFLINYILKIFSYLKTKNNLMTLK